MKNLLLMKDQPSICYEGVVYPMSKGTVIGWVEFQKEWRLPGNFMYIGEEEFKKNPTWYKLTTKKPTFPLITINGHEVIFKEGKVKIGCTTVSNSIVKTIYESLTD